MFVPSIDKDRPHPFYVYRASDRCVCGCSAVTTSNRYPDSGYCRTCSEKREQFVNSIIGDINLGKQDDICSIVLSQVEQVRKLMIREILYYIIDSHYAKYNNGAGNFIEPYQKPNFVNHCLCVKSMAMEKLLETIVVPNFKSKNKFHDSLVEMQNWYLCQVREMLEVDLDTKNDLSAVNQKIKKLIK